MSLTDQPEAIIASRYEVGSDPDLEKRIAEGTVVIATLNVFQRWTNHLMFARNPVFSRDVVIHGAEAIGKGQHGDIVAVELDVAGKAQDVVPSSPSSLNTDVVGERDSSSDSGDDGDEDTPALFADGVPQEQAMPSTLPDGRPIVPSLIGERGGDGPPQSLVAQLSAQLGAPTDLAQRWPKEVEQRGRVVKVLHRAMNAYVVARIAEGVLRPGQFIASNYMYRCRPYNPLLPQVAVRGGDIPEPLHRDLADSLLLLRLCTTPTGDLQHAFGDIIQTMFVAKLGSADSSEANTMAICAQHDVPSESFDDDVEACVPPTFVVPDKAELLRMGRRDLRDDEFVCTIDPSTARDLDDALSIRRASSGGYHVGVHIADVSFFVRPGTAIDEEARRRSTSTYLVDRVIPMLPRKLSEDYCSLNPGTDRFAYSCLFELDRECHVVSEWFGQSVIRSRCRLAYEEAQQILDGQDVLLDVEQEAQITGESTTALQAKVRQSVQLLFEAAQKMRRESLQHGRVSVPNSKLGFLFPTKDSKLAPSGFYISQQIFANWVVEEFMLLANTRTAQKVVQYLPESALLRHHAPPKPEKMAVLKAGVEAAGIHVLGSSASALQRTVDEARTNTHFAAFCVLMKYTFSAAEYMANDSESTTPRSHFALGLEWYTHFTSPIRRYCDIVAHRQLSLAVEVEERLRALHKTLPAVTDANVVARPGARPFDITDTIDPESLSCRDYFYTHTEVGDIAENANLRKNEARKAGEESTQLFFCLYLRATVRKAAVDPRYPSHPCAKAMVVTLKSSTVTIYAESIACEMQLGLRDNKQLFTLVLPPTEEVAAKSAPAVGGGAPATKQAKKAQAKRVAKGGKANMVHHGGTQHTTRQGDPTSVKLDWGINPETSTACIEELHLFSEVTAELTTSFAAGPMSLCPILIPPWLRERALATNGNIPTTLD